MKKELVSIIIPIYNLSKYLEQCVLSVLQQSYKEIQVILVNNDSNDTSLDIEI